MTKPPITKLPMSELLMTYCLLLFGSRLRG
jgi:hypothetical protein